MRSGTCDHRGKLRDKQKRCSTCVYWQTFKLRFWTWYILSLFIPCTSSHHFLFQHKIVKRKLPVLIKTCKVFGTNAGFRELSTRWRTRRMWIDITGEGTAGQRCLIFLGQPHLWPPFGSTVIVGLFFFYKNNNFTQWTLICSAELSQTRCNSVGFSSAILGLLTINDIYTMGQKAYLEAWKKWILEQVCCLRPWLPLLSISAPFLSRKKSRTLWYENIFFSFGK